jgi:hypothetical protein
MFTKYDPNIIWSRHTLELTFMQWDYSLNIEVDVCGNCKGASLFGTAIAVAFEDLWDDDEQNAQIILRRPSEDGEDTLEVDLEDESELEKLCIAIRIVKHEKELK